MRICKYCLQEKSNFCDKDSNRCKDCYNKADLVANPRFTIEDYINSRPLHPVDKYKKEK